jgi:hypothetical protein
VQLSLLFEAFYLVVATRGQYGIASLSPLPI